MELQVDIEFNQLVQLAKQLTSTQWAKLKSEVEEKEVADSKRAEFREFLLGGPTFSKRQLDTMAETTPST